VGWPSLLISGNNLRGCEYGVGRKVCVGVWWERVCVGGGGWGVGVGGQVCGWEGLCGRLGVWADEVVQGLRMLDQRKITVATMKESAPTRRRVHSAHHIIEAVSCTRASSRRPSHAYLGR
jgi:hypothetical protein